MSRILCVFAGLLLFLSPASSLYADSLAPSQPDTSTWYVISKSGAERFASVLPLELPLKGGWRVATVSIEKDRVRICLEGGGASQTEPPRKECGVLFHPKQAFPGSEPVGAVGSLLMTGQDTASPAWAGIREAVAGLSAELWQQVRRESPDPIGNNHGFSRALWYLLAKNETRLASQLLESLSLQHVQARTLTLFEALILGQEGERTKADELLDTLQEERDPHVILVRGRVAMLNEDVEAGATLLAQALATLPPDSANRCHPAVDIPRLLAKVGRQAEAVAAWESLLDRFPDCKSMWSSFSGQLLDWGLTDQAMEQTERALALNPDNEAFLFHKVAILRRQKKLPEAIALLDHMNRLNPNQEHVINLHSTLASSLTPPDDYRAVLLARIEADPEDLLAIHGAGVVSYYVDDYTTSVRLMDLAREALPDNARAHIYAAMSRYHLGRWDEAKAGLDHLADIGTSDPDLHYCYAMLLSTRDTEAARRHLEQYLAVPHQPDAIPAKQERAWREWEMLVAGEVPPDWLPGAVQGSH